MGLIKLFIIKKMVKERVNSVNRNLYHRNFTNFSLERNEIVECENILEFCMCSMF